MTKDTSTTKCLIPQAWPESYTKSGQTRIISVIKNKKRYLPLLLIGDEQENMIDKYLERGEMLVMEDANGATLSTAVVTNEGNGILELKNLAVEPRFQRKGYGRKMIACLRERYKDNFHTLIAGTGDSNQTVSFYKNCGFEYSHTIKNFFVDNYDHPIIEDGKTLKDMIYFKLRLSCKT